MTTTMWTTRQSAAPDSAPAHARTSCPRSNGKPLRILIVDDHPLVCESLKQVLECDSHTIEIACSGAEALEKFDPQSFALVFLDLVMPGMHGDRLAAEIRKRAPHIGIILLTAFPPAGLPPSVDMVLPKPFSVPAIRSATARLIAIAS